MSTDNTERVENTRAFWDATVALEERAAQSCLNRIAALTPEITAFGFDAETEEDDLPGGEPSDGVVAAGTPRGMVGAWNGGGEVSLKLMSREDHCCAKVGAIMLGPADFKACAAGTPDGEDGCAIIGHHDRRAKQHILNLDPGGNYLAICMKSSSSTVVFSSPILEVGPLLETMPEVVELLLNLKAPPRALRVALRGYPGEEGIEAISRGILLRRSADAVRTPSAFLEEVGSGPGETPGPSGVAKAKRRRPPKKKAADHPMSVKIPLVEGAAQDKPLTVLRLTQEFHRVKSDGSGSESGEDWVGSEDSEASQQPTGDQGQGAAGGPGGDDDPSSDSSSGGSREPSDDDESSNEGGDAVPEPSETALKKEVATIQLDLANARERILTLEAANITQKLAYSVKAIDYTQRLDHMEEKATKARPPRNSRPRSRPLRQSRRGGDDRWPTHLHTEGDEVAR